jgi:hypothetical protein
MWAIIIMTERSDHYRTVYMSNVPGVADNIGTGTDMHTLALFAYISSFMYTYLPQLRSDSIHRYHTEFGIVHVKYLDIYIHTYLAVKMGTIHMYNSLISVYICIGI